MAARLTVIIPCKNERTNIGPCIDAALRVADEVLVADSGSTDGTLQYVCARGDCRVIEREYVRSGDFKNWAIPQATHEWVLIVDADERVTPELAAEISDILRRGPEHDAYWVTRTNYFLGRRVRHTDWARDRLMRFFRRDLGRYEGPSDHGDVRVPTGNVGALRSPLTHYSMWSWGQYMQKFDRYTRVQAEQWYAAGQRASWTKMLVRPPLRFLREYVLHRGFLDGAVGLQIACLAAFYTFMKQARLWELHHALTQQDLEGEAMAAAEREAA
jgi:glycosyltransferase involved in cell wall biosynthesis